MSTERHNVHPYDLRPGDRFDREGTAVTVMREGEPWRDRFGLSLVRFWCSRSDTGAEGWVAFGPSAIELEVERQPTAREHPNT